MPAIVRLWLGHWFIALGFLTRLPIGRRMHVSASLAEAAPAFPLVGALVGVLGALAFWICDGLGLGPVLAALAAVGTTILATGALHEDGLADVADGFGGGFGRERKLEIMRDSAIGSFGVLALLFSVGLRVVALAMLHDPGPAALALIASHAVSRSALPAVMAWAPLARSDGLAAGAGRPSPGAAGLGLLLAALVALLALGFGAGLLALLFGGLAGAAVLALARRQIGGHSGDVLGAIEQAVECGVLLTLVALR